MLYNELTKPRKHQTSEHFCEIKPSYKIKNIKWTINIEKFTVQLQFWLTIAKDLVSLDLTIKPKEDRRNECLGLLDRIANKKDFIINTMVSPTGKVNGTLQPLHNRKSSNEQIKDQISFVFDRRGIADRTHHVILLITAFSFFIETEKCPQRTSFLSV